MTPLDRENLQLSRQISFPYAHSVQYFFQSVWARYVSWYNFFVDFFISLLLSIIAFLGNTSFESVPQSDPSATSTSTSTTAEVIRVIDGDTIVVRIAGEEKTIRYIGIDTPEPYRDGEPACFSLEASLKNKELVQGKAVRLESDRGDTDKYHRLLRYVYVDDVFVNAELVRGGYARKLTIKPNTKYNDQFSDLESKANEQGIGLWGRCQ